MSELLCVQEVFFESVAERDGYFLHCAVSGAVVAEVVIDAYPFLVFAGEFGAEVCEEVHFLPGAVDEVVLSADDGEFAFCPYGFRLAGLFFVGFFLYGEFRVLHEVDAEVFVPDVFPCVGVAERRIIVKVEGYLAAVEQPFA